ncbi:hypothetical protein [Nocardia xishanensis]
MGGKTVGVVHGLKPLSHKGFFAWIGAAVAGSALKANAQASTEAIATSREVLYSDVVLHSE